MWYPENAEELNKLLNEYLNQKTIKEIKKINGIIVPHAGYVYSGKIAAKAFSLIKSKKIDRAIVLGPSHYIYLKKVVTSEKFYWQTPLGKIKIFNTGFPTSNIDREHSIKNQIPFLQKLKTKEIMPLMVGEIMPEEAEKVAKKISQTNALYVFSTDLSHFLHYTNAVQRDKNTIRIIENLELENWKNIDACGLYPLLILFYLCKILNTRPHLIEYKNSGDVTNQRNTGVVGYASFYF